MIKRKYRIKIIEDYSPHYLIQMRILWMWVTVKSFYDPWDSEYARLCADELLELLSRKD